MFRTNRVQTKPKWPRLQLLRRKRALSSMAEPNVHPDKWFALPDQDGNVLIRPRHVDTCARKEWQ